MVTALGAANAHIETKSATIEASDEGYTLAAEFILELPRGLSEALQKGVPLYFVVEGEVVRPRWYWSSERTGALTQTRRIAYNALTRQFHVGVVTGEAHGGTASPLYQSVPTLADALRFVSRVGGLKLAEKSDIVNGVQYQVGARLCLDTTQLPKPLQINVLTSADWKLACDWRKFPFVQPAPIGTAGNAGTAGTAGTTGTAGEAK